MPGTSVSADSAPQEEAVSGVPGHLHPVLWESYQGSLQTVRTSSLAARSCTEGETKATGCWSSARPTLSPQDLGWTARWQQALGLRSFSHSKLIMSGWVPLGDEAIIVAAVFKNQLCTV